MYHSRDIDDLCGDVAANCRVFLELCKEAGLQVLVTETVRDEEYQMDCWKKGFSQSKTSSFHGIEAGLAFDICKNVKGHEYDDSVFFAACGAIGERVGFEWGGRWKSFPDRPHFQWSQGGKYTSAMVRAGRYPPAMARYEEEIDMTKDEVKALVHSEVQRGIAEYEEAVSTHRNRPVDGYATGAWVKAKTAGVMDGTRPCAPLLRQELAVIADRLGLLEKEEK